MLMLTYVRFTDVVISKGSRDTFFNLEISRGHFPFPGRGNAHSLVRWEQLRQLLDSQGFSYVYPPSSVLLVDMES